MDGERLRYVARALPTWVGHHASNMWGILNVFDLVWLHPMPGGLVDASHPFGTGISPESGDTIWEKNILFATDSDPDRYEADSVIVHCVMKYICAMVGHSTSSPEHPVGRTAGMPPAINLLHGPVHYNGVSLLFNDTREAVRHFTDREFVRECDMTDSVGRC